MKLSDEIAYISTVEIARRIRQRELSPVEVIDAFIARIEARNPSLNAFVHCAFDEARETAKESERAVMSGAALGPLHGVPVALKDLFDMKPGWPTTFGGIRALKDFVPGAHCAFAERIERAGAILVGKTNSPVLGFCGATDNALFGPTRNPFNTAKNSGGSSGGAAAAVADGMLPLAEGTDGGGSIRIPAAWCGVYGYKASFGRVPFLSRPNGFSGASPYLFEGPITRTVEDAALAMTALAGYDRRDTFSLDGEVDFLAATRRSVQGMKIAYSPNFDIYPVDRRVTDTVGTAVRAFEEAGAHVEEVKIGLTRSQSELSDLWCRLVAPLNVGFFESFKEQGLDLRKDHSDDFPPELLRWLDIGYEMTALDASKDQALRTEVFDAIQNVFESYDLLITPTLACLPVDNAKRGITTGPTEINGEAVDPLIGWCMTYLINFTGHPAASIPAGLVDGLPVGMQIIGRRNADADVFAASAAFERMRPWRESYSICADRALTPPVR